MHVWSHVIMHIYSQKLVNLKWNKTHVLLSTCKLYVHMYNQNFLFHAFRNYELLSHNFMNRGNNFLAYYTYQIMLHFLKYLKIL